MNAIMVCMNFELGENPTPIYSVKSDLEAVGFIANCGSCLLYVRRPI